jgi:hypothetical protein
MQGPPPRARDTDAGARLFKWVDEVLRTNGAKAAERLRKHEPHVMAAYMVVSAVEEARGETEELARTRAGPAWDVIKQLRLHTGISGVYNRLGKSEESQRLVVNMLLEKVRARGRGPFSSPSTHGHTHAHLWFDVFDSLQVVQAAEVSAAPQVLRFALCTVASELLAVAESENFIMTDHANPLQLARVAVGLCRAKPELAEILRAEFYRTCPLTVPRQPEPGLAGPAVLENMGFKDKESREDWLARMNRVLCTYAVLVAQPEGAASPFVRSAHLPTIARRFPRYIVLHVLYALSCLAPYLLLARVVLSLPHRGWAAWPLRPLSIHRPALTCVVVSPGGGGRLWRPGTRYRR